MIQPPLKPIVCSLSVVLQVPPPPSSSLSRPDRRRVGRDGDPDGAGDFVDLPWGAPRSSHFPDVS